MAHDTQSGQQAQSKEHMSSLLVVTLTMRELHHWPSIVTMSPQSHCSDEEDGRIEYIYIKLIF